VACEESADREGVAGRVGSWALVGYRFGFGRLLAYHVCLYETISRVSSIGHFNLMPKPLDSEGGPLTVHHIAVECRGWFVAGPTKRPLYPIISYKHGSSHVTLNGTLCADGVLRGSRLLQV
jgi:hypothetical protein